MDFLKIIFSAENRAFSEFCSLDVFYMSTSEDELCFIGACTSAVTLYIFTFYKSISEQFLPPLFQSSLCVRAYTELMHLV